MAPASAPHTVLLSGIFCAAAAVWFSRELPEIRSVVRPIYVQMGILPQVASGLQSAAQLMTPPSLGGRGGSLLTLTYLGASRVMPNGFTGSSRVCPATVACPRNMQARRAPETASGGSAPCARG